MHKTLSFVKKYTVVGILTGAVTVLALSNYQLQNKVNNSFNKVLAFEESNLDLSKINQDTVPIVESSGDTFPQSSLPHPNCVMQLAHGYETSDAYNPNTPYNLSFFMGGQTGFQEINGDGLTDYVYVSSNYGGTNPDSRYTGCIYLNNGNGWTRVHICSAWTQVDIDTGEVINAEYRGDCAGEPNAKLNS
jgi:hypothetical protein